MTIHPAILILIFICAGILGMLVMAILSSRRSIKTSAKYYDAINLLDEIYTWQINKVKHKIDSPFPLGKIKKALNIK